jgi:hypothetical protein
VVLGSLDCPFLIVTSSFCVPCGAEFSGLSVFDCQKTDNPENPAPQGTQDEEVAIKNEHSREQGTQDEEVAIKNGQSVLCALFSGMFVFNCHFFVLCALWCWVLWIVRF